MPWILAHHKTTRSKNSSGGNRGNNMQHVSARIGNVVMLLLFSISLFNPVLSDNVHVSVKNRLGNGRIMTLHCQSGDNDMGVQNVADGSEFGWDFSVNAWGTTLFFCDIGWESVQQYHFDAYSFERDYVRCETQCSWLISEEGMYYLNGQTGFWEFNYQWPN